ncbi:MAG: signal transduction histidine kinase [Flammeovirgaceae bacterium]|jgi:two-component system sensor histidine kinase/response regulator
MNTQKKYTVLVIDDEVIHIKKIASILPKETYQIFRAPDGEIGCELAIKRQPDIIIMDWQMPKRNGIESIKFLKNNPLTQDIPVIMATGVMIEPEYLAIALEAGAVDFLQKPIEPTELLARVNSALILSKAMQSIREKNKELEKKTEIQDRLMAIVGHDLKSPLYSLQGTLSIARQFGEKGISSEELFHFLGQIEEEFDSVIGLINGLLFWALNKQDAFNHSPEKVNISNFFETSIKLTKIQAKKKEINLKYTPPKDLWAYLDINMVNFIVRNLLSNAIKFTPKAGNISIEVTNIEKYLLISIEDTGTGMSEEQKEKLFGAIDPSKVNSDTYGRKGTGLGMAVAYDFVDKMSGSIWVESEEGKGSTFFVKLPNCISKD